jgi:hypothetical protein
MNGAFASLSIVEKPEHNTKQSSNVPDGIITNTRAFLGGKFRSPVE